MNHLEGAKTLGLKAIHPTESEESDDCRHTKGDLG